MMTNKTIPLKDHILSPNFRGLRSRNYATTIKYFDAANTSVSKRIDYTINILLTSKENRYLLNIDKKHFWFNRHQPDLINERIAEDLAKTIHPVQVGTDEKGNYSGITNFNEITNGRWHRNKFSATQKYTTPIAKSFYEAFERNLEDRKTFEKSMEYDWFWNLFFHPLYVNYSSLHKVETELSLAVVPYKNPVKFKGIQEINPEITRYHSVEIQFKSFEMKAEDYFIPKNSGMKTDDFFMKVHVFFDLDVFHLFPMHIRAYFEVYTKDSEGKETPVRRIEFTHYQQNTEKNKTAPAEKRSPFLVYDEEEDEDEEIYKTYDGVNYTRQQWIDFENAQYKIYMEKKKKKGFWDFFG